jgi:hypothetical protein
MLAKLSDQQLAQKANPKASDIDTLAAVQGEQAFRTNARQGAASTPGFAPGGIVAFAGGGDTDDAVAQMGKYETPDQSTLNAFYAKNAPGTPAPLAQAQPTQTPDMMAIAEQRKNAGSAYLEALKNARPDKNEQLWNQLMSLGVNTAAGTSSNPLTNLAAGAQKTLPQVMEDAKARRQSEIEMAKAGYDISNVDTGTLIEIAKNASQNREKELDRLMHLGMSKQQADATIRSAELHLEAARGNNAATLAAAKIGHSPQERLEGIRTKAYVDTYNNVIKTMQDKLGIDKVTPEQYKQAREIAKSAAMDAVTFAKEAGGSKSNEVDFNKLPK